MGSSTKAPVKLQIFPQQKLKGLPKDQDVELTVVPKQVLQVQGLTLDRNAPTLTVKVDSNCKSSLHYSPQGCRTGAEACFDTPGLHEVWVPRTDKDFARISIGGLSRAVDLMLPRYLFEPSQPFSILIGEAVGEDGKPPFPLPTGAPPLNLFPEGPEDFFIAVADTTGVLKGKGFPEGARQLSSLSREQREAIGALIKDVAATGGEVLDNTDLLRDFRFKGKFYLKSRNGIDYVVFQGNSGLRKVFRGSQYNLAKDYSRLSILTIKQGVKQASKHALGGVTRVSKGTTIGFLFMGFANTWDWLAGEEQERFVSDLVVQIGSDVAKSMLTAIVAALVVAVALSFLSAPVTSICGLVLGTISVGFFIGKGVDAIDKKIQLTDKAKALGQKVAEGFERSWEELVVDPMDRVLLF